MQMGVTADETNEQEASTASEDQNERLVMLPPYVEPEHRQLIEAAESALVEYEEYLLKKIKEKLFDYSWELEPHPDDIRKAERTYHEDPTRTLLLKHLSSVKLLCERPRFMIKRT